MHHKKKIELLAPAGSMACLKAAVSKGADSVYLGMRRFSARGFAANFTGNFLKEAVRICRSNGVKLYLAMNTLVKNYELDGFFRQLSFAYSAGIDSVIIQEISFLDIIKRSYPGLDVHISTQAGVMNTAHAGLLEKAD
ncbi:U32 family peptidase, partial [Candidatus Woesearchaeota archaeon]|nr:U32 family peptidase [Candidatus Woesearchaeota archaeon]